LLSNGPASLADQEAADRAQYEQTKAYHAWSLSRHRSEQRQLRECRKAYLAAVGVDPLRYAVSAETDKTLRTFLRRATVGVIKDALRLTSERMPADDQDAWHRYFCGVMWRKIKLDQ
jgi:hypothetical protein